MSASQEVMKKFRRAGDKKAQELERERGLRISLMLSKEEGNGKEDVQRKVEVEEPKDWSRKKQSDESEDQKGKP